MPRSHDKLLQRKFLAAYADCGNLTLAALTASVARKSHYNWLTDEGYRLAFEEAHETAADLLEAEARRRGAEGWEEPIVYQGALCYEATKNGKRGKPIAIRKYDSNLLMFLLKGIRPERYRETWKGEIKHSGAISRGPDLSRLSDEELANLERIARSAIPAAEAIVESGEYSSGEAEKSPEKD